MPVSSTFRTSAPKSASNNEQKPPGKSRERSRTRIPSKGPVIAQSLPPATRHLPPSRLHPLRRPQELAGFAHGCNASAHGLHDLASLRDQVAVRARHLAVRQVEVVLQADAHVSAQ